MLGGDEVREWQCRGLGGQTGPPGTLGCTDTGTSSLSLLECVIHTIHGLRGSKKHAPGEGVGNKDFAGPKAQQSTIFPSFEVGDLSPPSYFPAFFEVKVHPASVCMLTHTPTPTPP